MVSKLLLTIQLCPKTEFQSSERFGEDLSDNTWEYIFAIDLLCCHQKWVWTHDNIIRYGAACTLGSGLALSRRGSSRVRRLVQASRSQLAFRFGSEVTKPPQRCSCHGDILFHSFVGPATTFCYSL